MQHIIFSSTRSNSVAAQSSLATDVFRKHCQVGAPGDTHPRRMLSTDMNGPVVDSLPIFIQLGIKIPTIYITNRLEVVPGVADNLKEYRYKKEK